MRAIALVLLGVLCGAACAAPPTRRSKTVFADPEPRSVVGPRWMLRRAVCLDDGRPIHAIRGELEVAERDRELLLTLALSTEACAWTSLLTGQGGPECADAGCPVRLVERWRVVAGPEQCALRPDGVSDTVLRRRGRELSFTLSSTALCSAGDARLDLEVLGPLPRDLRSLVRVALANLRIGNAEALAPLLTDDATLSESRLGAGPVDEPARGRSAVVERLSHRPSAPDANGIRLLTLTQVDASRYAAAWEQPGAPQERGVTHVRFRGERIVALEDVYPNE